MKIIVFIKPDFEVRKRGAILHACMHVLRNISSTALDVQ